MARQKVVILGSTGMLGWMMLDFFAGSQEFEIIATYRDLKIGKLLQNRYPRVDFRLFDAEKANLKNILAVTKSANWLVNAIGIIKPFIHEDNPAEIQLAIRVNALFPYLLASAASQAGFKVIQIATDCVYSGRKGQYVESDPHDGFDIYGQTKSLGEVFGEGIYHLRSSIIGPELTGHLSLMDWFLGQPKGAEVDGFTNHQWNGLTTLQFARICHGMIKKGRDIPHVQHIIPGNLLSKADLLKSLAQEFKRQDITLQGTLAPIAIDRTLSTKNPKLNQQLWQSAGYDSPPSIQTMVRELAQYELARKDNRL